MGGLPKVGYRADAEFAVNATKRAAFRERIEERPTMRQNGRMQVAGISRNDLPIRTRRIIGQQDESDRQSIYQH